MEPQRVPEDVGDLVPVQDPGPVRPGGVLCPVVEVVEEDPGGETLEFNILRGELLKTTSS